MHPNFDYRKLPIVPPRPSVPIPYAAGTVELEPNKVHNLLELIWRDINRDVPGTSVELRVWAHPTNVAPVYLGQFMGNPLQQEARESIWDNGVSVWDHGESRWDKREKTPPNEGRPGPLNTDHYALFLTPMGEPRIYRSTYPGGGNGIGNLQVFSQAEAKLHIEVVE